MMADEAAPALVPDKDAIRADLTWMTARWSELNQPLWFEVRAIAEGIPAHTFKYRPHDIDSAVELILDMNARQRNIYVVRNPIRDNVVGSAEDQNIVAAFYLWADCDDAEASQKVRDFDGPKWTAAVITGKIPSTRVHAYWELQDPITDMAAWQNLQRRIVGRFDSDSVVTNPSRIMRVAGTVTYPSILKATTRGYVSEVATIKTDYSNRAPVTPDSIGAFLPDNVVTLHKTRVAGGLQIDTGTGFAPPLDRDRLAIQAMSGMEWHNAVIRLVASYVGKGMSDDEIHTLTQPLTLAGYTGDQTAREVQTAIDGARRKGWTPEVAAVTQSFDHPPEPVAAAQPDAPAPQTTWRVQRADEFTADFVAPEYIIDGVVQRGRVYTLTAPTGSGKTAVMLYASTSIATGSDFCAHAVQHGDVLFMAGENPDDVRARVIATMEFHSIKPENCRLHFIAGTFSIRADLERLKAEAAKLPNLLLVVIDTFAAYFDGDDENSNTQALDFARLVRKIAAFPSKPAVIMPAHPVKNATKQNLSPKGGSSLLNEVDGNLTLWNESGILTMHWQGKFRGAEFEALPLELHRYESAQIVDSNGVIMPTILARPLPGIRAAELIKAAISLEDKLLLNIADAPNLSQRDRCGVLGVDSRSKLRRAIEKLMKEKLVRLFRTNLELTKDGEKAVEMIKNGERVAEETDGL